MCWQNEIGDEIIEPHLWGSWVVALIKETSTRSIDNDINVCHLSNGCCRLMWHLLCKHQLESD